MTDQFSARIDPAVAEAFPDFYMSVHVFGAATDAAVDVEALAAMQRVAAGEAAAARRAGSITRWKEVFAKIGARSGVQPSIQALDKRIAKMGSPREINPRVDCYNAISAALGVPMGGYELAKLEKDLSLEFAEPGQPFVGYGMDEPEPTRAGEVIYVSAGRVVCRYWNYKDATFSAIIPESGAVCFVGDVLAGNCDEARAVHEALADSLEKLLCVRHDLRDLIGAGTKRLTSINV
jgi:DNA/RNA-binding domain of Phe-tRNA-synthetase-like protein